MDSRLNFLPRVSQIRLLSFSQNSFASSQVTFSTGRFAPLKSDHFYLIYLSFLFYESRQTAFSRPGGFFLPKIQEFSRKRPAVLRKTLSKRDRRPQGVDAENQKEPQ
jgi:hypothetical protein